jgi:hypothetical protein
MFWPMHFTIHVDSGRVCACAKVSSRISGNDDLTRVSTLGTWSLGSVPLALARVRLESHCGSDRPSGMNRNSAVQWVFTYKNVVWNVVGWKVSRGLGMVISTHYIYIYSIYTSILPLVCHFGRRHASCRLPLKWTNLPQLVKGICSLVIHVH